VASTAAIERGQAFGVARQHAACGLRVPWEAARDERE